MLNRVLVFELVDDLWIGDRVFLLGKGRQSQADGRPYEGQKCEPFHRLF